MAAPPRRLARGMGGLLRHASPQQFRDEYAALKAANPGLSEDAVRQQAARALQSKGYSGINVDGAETTFDAADLGAVLAQPPKGGGLAGIAGTIGTSALAAHAMLGEGAQAAADSPVGRGIQGARDSVEGSALGRLLGDAGDAYGRGQDAFAPETREGLAGASRTAGAYAADAIPAATSVTNLLSAAGVEGDALDALLAPVDGLTGPARHGAGFAAQAVGDLFGDVVEDPARAAYEYGLEPLDVATSPDRWGDEPLMALMGAADITGAGFAAKGLAGAGRKALANRSVRAWDALPNPSQSSPTPRTRSQELYEGVLGRPSNKRREAIEFVNDQRADRVQGVAQRHSPLPDTPEYQRRALEQVEERQFPMLMDEIPGRPLGASDIRYEERVRDVFPDSSVEGVSRRIRIGGDRPTGQLHGARHGDMIQGDYLVAGRNLESTRDAINMRRSGYVREGDTWRYGTPRERARSARQPGTPEELNALDDAIERMVAAAPARRPGQRTALQDAADLDDMERDLLRNEAVAGANGIRRPIVGPATRRLGAVATPAVGVTGALALTQDGMLDPEQDPSAGPVDDVMRELGLVPETPSKTLQPTTYDRIAKPYEQNFEWPEMSPQTDPLGPSLLDAGLLDARQAQTLSQYGADLRFDSNKEAAARARLTPEEQVVLDQLLAGRGTEQLRHPDGSLDLGDDFTGRRGLRDARVPGILDELAPFYEGEVLPPEPPTREALAAPQDVQMRGISMATADIGAGYYGEPSVPSQREGAQDGSPLLPQEGADVRGLQRSLNRAFGADLQVDGIIGPSTSAAIERLEEIWGEPLGDDVYAPDGTYDMGQVNRIKDRVDRLVDQASVREIQALLNKGGFDAGPEDNKPGPLTLKGINSARVEAGLEPLEGLPPQSDKKAWIDLLREMLGDPRAVREKTDGPTIRTFGRPPSLSIEAEPPAAKEVFFPKPERAPVPLD